MSATVGNEAVKAASRHLRGPLAADLADGTDAFSAEGQLLLKFHGVYQQDNRDVRRERAARRLPLAYSCMVRAAIPGGVLSAEQYLVMDGLADELSNGTLRITTRQGLQYHFVAKDGLRPLIATLNRQLVSTLAACGDVVRNVVACPAPVADRDQASLLAAARRLAERFRPQTRAYWELWIDGEPAVTAAAPPDEAETIYGDAYLPRKFKIGFAWPGDNCVDVYSDDIGLVPVAVDGEPGYVVLVGGGMGMSHAREDDTYPRLATPLAWAPAPELGAVCEAIVLTQRDLGNREDRQRARLKYTVDTLGEGAFRHEVERRYGAPLHPPVALPGWDHGHDAQDHLGWHQQPDGRWFIGVHVDSGRLVDTDDQRLRTALRAVVASHATEVRFTARQDVLLCGIEASSRGAVEAILAEHGVPAVTDLTPLRRHALACPALPTCGQALAEAERALLPLVGELDRELAERQLGDLPLRLNMTGCPNGCARPYTAEIGVVGRTKTGYDVYVGGSVAGDRLAERVAAGVALGDVPAAVAALLDRYRAEAAPGEAFGEYCARVGAASLAGSVPVAGPRRRERAAAR